MTDGPKPTALEDRSADGVKLFSPSTARNRDVIRDVFLKHLPTDARVLEVGSGTGEHGVHIACAAPGISWRAGDPDGAARASIAAWIDSSRLDNLSGPHDLDVSSTWWEAEPGPFEAVVSINMVHIAPFEAAQGLFAGAGQVLVPGGQLILYGPFARAGVHSAPSNEAFDASLKARDPRWGVRDLEHDIAPLAQEHSLALKEVVEMPANNLTVIFVRK